MSIGAATRRVTAIMPSAQLVVIGGLMAILAMFILPMPPLLLDVFIAFNLTVSALLLIAVIGVRQPL